MQKENKLTRNFIIGTFVTLYVMVSIISTIHVIDFFRLSNPEWLAITLALSFEVGAAASLASIIALKKMNKGIVWVLFFTLTAMQAMGNAYFAYMHLKDYQGWIELFGLVDSEVIEQKRILSIVSGAILPLVALGFIKSLVDYIKPDEGVNEGVNKGVNDQITDAVTQMSDHEIVQAAEKIQTQKIWDKVAELREEGKLPTPTQEDIEDEPTALANSQYREQEMETIVDEIPEGEVEEPLKEYTGTYDDFLIERPFPIVDPAREEALVEMMRLDQENGLYDEPNYLTEEPILGNEEPIEVIVEEPMIEQPIEVESIPTQEVIEEQVTEESDEKKNLN
jgi:hypothetical protein